MNPVLIGILLYVLFQLGLGVYVSRRLRTEEDYLVAGRRLGYGVITMTVFATWFGAETCVGAAGAIYDDGLSGGRIDPLGYSLCIIFMGLFFAASFYKRKCVTLADFYRQRYGAGVEKLTAIILVPASLLWAGAQVRAFGTVLAAASNMNFTLAVAIAASVVIIYTTFGGLLADAITDVLQGVVLVVGLLVIFVIILTQHLTPEIIAEAFSAERLSLRGMESSWLASLETWAVPIMGSLFAQELVSRLLAAKSVQVARRGMLAGGFLYLTVGLMPVILGLLGPSLIPGLENSEQLLPELAKRYLHVAFYTLFSGALISAILSTVDSALLAAGGLVSHNIVTPLLPDLSEIRKLRIARAAVVVFGVIAFLLAFMADSVLELVIEASAFGSAGIFATVVFGLHSRRGGAATAYATLLAGITSYVVFSKVPGVQVEFPFLTSVACSIVTFIVVGFIEQPPPPELLVRVEALEET